MKKLLSFLVLSLMVIVLAACGASEESKTEDTNANEGTENTETENTETTEPTKLVVGASNGLHDLILEQAQPLLAEEGIELEIVPYQDYVLPNEHLESGDLDAN